MSDVWESAGCDSMAASKGSLTVDGKQYGVPYAYYQWVFIIEKIYLMNLV